MSSIGEVIQGDPPCHVCGQPMYKRGTWGGKVKTSETDGLYDCMSCGATTGCTDPAEEQQPQFCKLCGDSEEAIVHHLDEDDEAGHKFEPASSEDSSLEH